MKVRLFHPTDATYRLAIVSIQPANEPGTCFISIGRGASRLSLTDSKLLGPYPESDGKAELDAVVKELKTLGYMASGIGDLLNTVRESKKPRLRAHAAERLGWRKEVQAVEALRERAQTPKKDITSVVLALGRIGDTQALPEISSEANKRLLSRRRAGAEALRLLGDEESIAGVEERARTRLGKIGVPDTSSEEAIWEGLKQLPAGKRGAALDALYDLGTEASVAVVRRVIAESSFKKLTAPGAWRFIKSVLKRSMARVDATTFALIMRGVELEGRTAKGGTIANLKSGLDGQTRPTRVFSQRTSDWLRRAAWRFMSMVGRHDPDSYPSVAAAVLTLAEDADDLPPKGKVPSTGHSYLLMRTLYSGGTRFVVDRRRPIHRRRPGVQPKGREEAFPELWDAPSALPAIRVLLAFGQHEAVNQFALRLADGRPDVLEGASNSELVGMLRHPSLWDDVSILLRARLRVIPLDTEALAQLANSENETAQAIASSVVTESAHLWIRDEDVAIRLLLGPPALREAAARLIRAAAPSLPAEVRAAYAARLVQTLDAPLPSEDAFDGLSEVIDLFVEELSASVGLDLAKKLLNRHAAGASVASEVLGRRADALEVLGAAEVMRLGQLAEAASRNVVVTMLQHHPTPFAERFGLLLELVEGEWDDVRAAGVRVLDHMSPSIVPEAGPPDVDRVLAVVDSTWPLVQEQGCTFVRGIVGRHPDPALNARLLACLAEHPHPNMRSFVLDLAEGLVGSGTPEGVEALRGLEPLLRAVLFDVRPRVSLRSRTVTLLVERGLQDSEQALLATRLLVDVARSSTQRLRDDALVGICTLAASFPSAQELAAADGIVVGAA